MQSRVPARVIVVAAAIAALISALITGASPASAGGPKHSYAALGDSFAAGIGAPPYPDPVCGRSESAYGPLLSQRLRRTTFSFPACSGAKVVDVSAGQLDVLDRHTHLVTLTVGGNDIGFSRGLAFCLQS